MYRVGFLIHLISRRQTKITRRISPTSGIWGGNTANNSLLQSPRRKHDFDNNWNVEYGISDSVFKLVVCLWWDILRDGSVSNKSLYRFALDHPEDVQKNIQPSRKLIWSWILCVRARWPGSRTHVEIAVWSRSKVFVIDLETSELIGYFSAPLQNM